MSYDPASYDRWLDSLTDGERPTVENFARSAIEPLPLLSIEPFRLHFRAWGYRSQAEFDAAIKDAFDQSEER